MTVRKHTHYFIATRNNQYSVKYNKKIIIMNLKSIMSIVSIMSIMSIVKAEEKTAIRFGDSTVERYAAEELQRYLSRVSGKKFILRDSTLKVWTPDRLTLPFPKAWAQAVNNVQERSQNPQMSKPETDEASKKLAAEESNFPAFILGTPETYPEYKNKLENLLKTVRKESDGYVIAPSADGKKLFITAYNSRGVLYGVYDFLQNSCGMGFFEDGEQVPEKINDNILPPFSSPPEKIVQEPKFDYRSQWLWSRYYGSDKGHPANWGYDEWVSHLRWMAQARFNSALIYSVGYTRIWGDVFKKAFPEVAPFDKEVFNDIDDFWGAHWSARAGWGRSPEETTRLMQKVYAFGREKLGMKFEFNFYLGDFEDTLQKAYPEGKWIDWSNVPHHAYFGAAGRQAILTFTDPKCKEFCQRFWKEFIKTFGTDHRYWISYREESAPNPDNPFDPDQGKSLADAVNAQRDWMLEIDPEAEFFHWDWHDMTLWINKEIRGQLATQKIDENLLKKLEASTQKYVQELSNDITMVSVIPPTQWQKELVDLTHHYKPHQWVIGSLLGYAAQDIGVGGLQTPAENFLSLWEKWLEDDKKFGSRLRGVFHWNEIIQVAPLLDHCVANFAWTGELPQHLYDSTKKDEILDWYFEHRYKKKNAKLFREANAFAYVNFPQGIHPIRIPTWINRAEINEAEKNQRTELIRFLKKIAAVEHEEKNNNAYKAELLDFGRVALHNISRLDLQEAISIAKNSKGTEKDKEEFNNAAKKAINSLTALADLLATDEKFCVSATLYRMLNEPGVNKQMRMVMLEHASGLLFDNYALNDSAEFIKIVSVPLLKSYLDGLRLTADNPTKFPFENYKKVEYIDGAAVLKKESVKDVDTTEEEISGLDKRLLELKNEFMELPALPFDVVKNKKQPAEVINKWLLKIK